MTVLRILAGAVLLNLMTGSLYAWSLFIAPAQEALDVGRAAVSSIFAVATVAFAATMFLAPVLVRPGTALIPALVATALAAGGLLVSGMAESLWGAILGYGVLFGIASGIAYSAALQSAVGALESRRGLATGIAVSSYALGAVVFAPLFRIGPERWGRVGHLSDRCSDLRGDGCRQRAPDRPGADPASPRPAGRRGRYPARSGACGSVFSAAVRPG